MFNKCLNSIYEPLRTINQNNGQDIHTGAEWSYNTSVDIVTTLTPCQGVYDKQPPSILTHIVGSSYIEATTIDSTLTSREEILAFYEKIFPKLKEKWKHKLISMEIFLSLANGARCTYAFNLFVNCSKVGSETIFSYTCPFQISKKVNPVSY